MPSKQYPDVAAARHMRDTPRGPRPEPKVAKPGQTGPRKIDTALPVTLRRDKGYRKKRLVASVLSVLVCLSVPSLVTLLVLFG